MTASVTRQEDQRAAVDPAGKIDIRGVAERSPHLLLADLGEPGHLVEPAPPDDTQRGAAHRPSPPCGTWSRRALALLPRTSWISSARALLVITSSIALRIAVRPADFRAPRIRVSTRRASRCDSSTPRP